MSRLCQERWNTLLSRLNLADDGITFAKLTAAYSKPTQTNMWPRVWPGWIALISPFLIETRLNWLSGFTMPDPTATR